MHRRNLVRDVLLALIVFLASWGALAQTPDVVYVPPFVLPSLEELTTAWVTGGATVFLVVLILRWLLGKWLAPKEPSELSTLLNRVLAVAVGLACGFAIPGVAMAPGVGGKVLGGLVCAAFGVFGRDIATSAVRGIKEVKDAP